MSQALVLHETVVVGGSNSLLVKALGVESAPFETREISADTNACL